MAHQVLADADKFFVPPRPREKDISRREIVFESIEIDAQFEGLAVDAVATVRGSPLVIYMSYKSRPIPAALLDPDKKGVGVLEIDLERLWSQIEPTTFRQVHRAEFERALVEDIGPKEWAFHPAQIREVQTQQPRRVSQAEVQTKRPRWVSQAEVRTRQPRLASQAEAQRPRDTAMDDSPLLTRYRCRHCNGTWFAGSSESDASQCAVCKQLSGVVIK